MKRLRFLAPLPLAFATSLFAQTPADDAILGAIRISSLDDLAASAGAFSDQIHPGSGANAAQLPAMAGAFGFATDQEILALVLDPQKSAQPFALVLPAADPEQLKANPAFNVQPVSGSTERFQLTLPNGLPMFATFVGKRLVLSPLEAGLDAVVPAIESGADIRRLRATGGQLALSLSTDRLYAAYKPMLDLMLVGMRGQFAKAAANKDAKAPNPADIFGSMLGTLGEVQDYSLSLSLQADHLDLHSTIVAKPGTSTAALLSAGRGPAVALPAAYDESSAMFGTFSARPTPEFWAAYNQFTTQLLSSVAAPDTEASKAMTKTINDFAAIWDGTGSMAALSPKQGMSGAGSMGITDREKALALLRTLPELQKSMAAINEAQGLATDVAFGTEETHGDARLIDVTQTYRALSPEMEEGLKSMQKLGMDKFTGTYGVTSSRLLYVMGESPRAETKRLLDAPAAASSAITPAAYGLPAESTAFVAISVPRYLGWMARMAEGMPFTYDATAAAEKPGLAFTTDLIDGRADIRVRLATSEIVAVKNSFNKPAAAPTATASE